jgi:hypothetical protein
MDTKSEGRNVVLEFILGLVFVIFVLPAVINLGIWLINTGYKIWFYRWGKCIESTIIDVRDGSKMIVRMTRKEARELGIEL